MTDDIRTTAEARENAAIPQVHEVHANPNETPGLCDVPQGLRAPADSKSPARWAYERLVLYIQNFEKQLDSQHEVAMGFAGGNIGVLRIEGLGYFDPDIITFYGVDGTGARTQLVQHVSQLSVMLRALPKPEGQGEPARIGFRLAADLESDEG